MSVKDIMEKMNADALAKQKADADVKRSTDGGENAPAETPPSMPVAQPLPSPVVPVRTSDKEVIFKSVKPTLGFFGPTGERISFLYGHLMTDDASLIDFIKKQMGSHVTVVDEGPLPAVKQEKEAK